MVGKLAVCVILLLVSVSARAHFTLCNAGRTLPISVAWASQTNGLIQSPIAVSGWTRIGPGRCDMLDTGDVDSTSFWVLAIANNVILPPGSRERGSAVSLSQDRFCVADKDFQYTGAGRGGNDQCAAGFHLQVFPVFALMPAFVGDFRLEMNPDEFFSSAGSSDGAAGKPTLPDLYGALVYSSEGGQYTSHYLDSKAEARQVALDACKTNEPQSTCTFSLAFKNQCMASVLGKTRGFTKVGMPGWTAQQTLDSALQGCNAKDGPGCREAVVSCSTWEERAAEREARDTQIQRNMLRNMDQMLRQIWR